MEIKFRFWHKSLKKMMTWEEVSDNYYLSVFNYDVSVPLQYTGLKDKNGKEIYAGDIATAKKYGTHAVTFEHGMFKLGSMSLCTFTNVGTEYWCEVIGNVHENPELEVRL